MRCLTGQHVGNAPDQEIQEQQVLTTISGPEQRGFT